MTRDEALEKAAREMALASEVLKGAATRINHEQAEAHMRLADKFMALAENLMWAR